MRGKEALSGVTPTLSPSRTHDMRNMDDKGTYFYQTFSKSSAGGLICGKRRRDERLSDGDLYWEFRNHVQKNSIIPTALISVSSRIIDTLQRAFNLFYEDEEKRNQIWIAFIYVPDSEKHMYHHAEDLAREYLDEECQNEEWRRYHYEYLFEWEIPKKYVMHTVSVETLMVRGLNMKEYLEPPPRDVLPSTSRLRQAVGKSILDPGNGYFTGLNLGIWARSFGARAPVCQIARQLLRDCLKVLFNDQKAQTMRVAYHGGDVLLEYGYFRDVEDGIDTAVLDWWLADSTFYDAYKEYTAWVSEME